MTPSRLIWSSLRYYWRTNLAVVAGVAIAVSVLSGALLVGDSVRGSLRELFLGRLGKASFVLSASHFFPETLASRMELLSEFRKRFKRSCPIIATQGVVTHQESRRRAAEVRVYGVDSRFWEFHQRAGAGAVELSQREALVSQPLAAETGIRAGDSVLVRLEAASDIPAESLHGRRENRGRTVRLTVRQVLPPGGLGEFSLYAEQQSVKAIFIPLGRLQKELGQEDRVNGVLVSEDSSSPQQTPGERAEVSAELERVVREVATLEDMAVLLRHLRRPGAGPEPNKDCLSLEKASTLLDEPLIARARAAAADAGLEPMPVLTYLANRIRRGSREIPYSLVTALDPHVMQALLPRSRSGEGGAPIWLNRWAADDLGASVGDRITLEYYLWREEGQLATETAEFSLAGILPFSGIAADRNLAPDYPGISDSDTLSDWDPPFPMDLGTIRPKDEAYWRDYRATPKAFVALADGQRLWRSRFGVLTSMRFFPPSNAGPPDEAKAAAARFRQEIQAKLSPFDMGFAVLPARDQGLVASRGATDFGQYFTYFSIFLVASALLLATLFFRLGVEQRLREVGLLKALGFAPRRLLGLFLVEGLSLASVGSVLGLGGAMAYAYVMVFLLRTWWVGAVGTTELALHVSASSLLAGAAGGLLSAAGCVVWTLWRMVPASPRSLLSGSFAGNALAAAVLSLEADREQRPNRPPRQGSRRVLIGAIVFSILGGALLAAAAAARLDEAAGFFGAGVSFLASLLCLQSVLLHRALPSLLKSANTATLWRLGFRQASHRAGRSVLCIALIAAATFIIVAVDAFRREGTVLAQARDGAEPQRPALASGTGGYPLLGQSLLPIFPDWNTPQGRETLGLSEQDSRAWNDSKVVRFRVRAGEDSSCLNLFQPKKPRILAPERGQPAEGRFAFKQTLAAESADKRNPWRLLERSFPDGAVPVIGDANSLAYVLHLRVGDDWLLQRSGGDPVKLRVVAALDDSVFQRELLMGEENFKRLFPEEQGYRFFLFDTSRDGAPELTQLLEDRFADEGLDLSFAEERLASFHRVENTYLSTFQFLGGLGLLLGTLGLAVVLLRNVLERRRELALLRAVGYSTRQLAAIILAENVFLLFRGAASGIVCALLAVLPAVASRGWRFSSGSLGWLLVAVVLSGLASSLLATRAALRSPLLEALHSE